MQKAIPASDFGLREGHEWGVFSVVLLNAYFASKKRSASNAAMQPKPALVIACR